MQLEVFPHYAADPIRVSVRHSEPSTFIIHKSIERDPSLRTEIIADLLRQFELFGNGHTALAVLFAGNTVYALMILSILIIAPTDGFIVKIGDVPKCTSCHKRFFDKTHQSFHGTFRKRMPCFA